MADILINNNFIISTSSACIVDLTPPTFAGITGLDVESRGQIRANWSAASDATAPIRYEVYIKASTNVGLFSTTNIISVTPNLQYDVFTLPDGSFLQNGVTYYVGVRAIDGVNNRDSNTVSMSVISTGVLTSIDVYESKAVFAISATNQFQGTLWGIKNDSLAIAPDAILGNASYQVYDKTGNAVVGMNGSSITPNSEGQYVITPVANLLSDSLDHYVVKVTINIDGEDRVNYTPIIEEKPDYKLNGLFFVNSDNDLDGSFWVSANEVFKTTGISNGSYQVYDHDGIAIVGMSESGIAPNGDGIFKIAHVPSLLIEDYRGFSVKITLTVNGVTKSQMLAFEGETVQYYPKAQFSINASNQLLATLWLATEEDVVSTGLGTANYTVYDANGVAVAGLTQTGITADVNGRFQITPVSAILLTDLTHYSVKIGIEVNGIEKTAYKGFTLLGT